MAYAGMEAGHPVRIVMHGPGGGSAGGKGSGGSFTPTGWCPGGERFSVSLATVELQASADGGTHLVLTEQGAFLDSVDGLEDRRSGTEGLLDELGEWLDTDAEGGVP